MTSSGVWDWRYWLNGIVLYVLARRSGRSCSQEATDGNGLGWPFCAAPLGLSMPWKVLDGVSPVLWRRESFCDLPVEDRNRPVLPLSSAIVTGSASSRLVLLGAAIPGCCDSRGGAPTTMYELENWPTAGADALAG
jgi:hypothetical protein